MMGGNDIVVGRITFEQVDRAHRNAKPKPEVNPAFANTHRDLDWALREIERLRAEVVGLNYAIKLSTGFVPVDTKKFIAMLEAYEIEVAKSHQD